MTASDEGVFYVEVTGHKKGPSLYGPYSKHEWDPAEVIAEFQRACEPGFQAELAAQEENVMGEPAEPTQEEREDRHKLSAAIVESVIADEKMPLPLTTVSIGGKGRFYPAAEVENLMFHLAHEITLFLAKRRDS